MAVRSGLSTQRLIVLIALTAGALTACLGQPNALPGAPQANPGSEVPGAATLPTGGGASAAGKVSDVRMRVVNLYAPKGDSGPAAPGPALDIYDVQLAGQAATPVATDVAYGSASPYFATHVPTNSFGNPAIQLVALPAGADPTTKEADARGVGGALDDGSHAQITMVLSADNSGLAMSGPLGRLAFSNRVEKGNDGNGGKAAIAPAPTSGRSEILVDMSAVRQGMSLYLLIDDSCDPPLNGDPNTKGLPYLYNGPINGVDTPYATFTTTPGSHQVSVVANTSETEPTCAGLTAKQGTTSVEVTAGAQVEVYVYGTSVTDLHLALAPLPS